MGKVTKIGAYQYMGLAADKPTAADCEENALYLELDTAKIQYVNGSEWREFGEEIVNWVTLFENEEVELVWDSESNVWTQYVDYDGGFAIDTKTRITIDGNEVFGTSFESGDYIEFSDGIGSGFVSVQTVEDETKLLVVAVLDEWELMTPTETVSLKIEQVR